MKVQFSRLAASDLLAISDYLIDNGMANPAVYLQRLQSACLGLVPMPERFSRVPGKEATNIRHRVIDSHIILYRIERDRVIVLRIVHGASEYEDLLDPSESA